VANSISPARRISLDVLHRVFTQGAFASAALRAEIKKSPGLSSADKRLATDMVYGVLRRRNPLDKAILQASNVERKKRVRRFKDLDPKLHDILRLAAYQIIFLDRVPDHAAVGEAVEQAKGRRGQAGARQTNAILRGLADTPADKRVPPAPHFDKDPLGHIAIAGSVSRGIAQIWIQDLGPQAARKLALDSLERAPLVLRANLLLTSQKELIEEVDGTAGEHPLAVHLPTRTGQLPAELACVREGRATVQDEASMHIIDLLDPKPGERILDVCAAPGGKTTAIAERVKDEATIIAHDRTPEKLQNIQNNAERLQLTSIQVAPVLPAISESQFDRVLVDAPCSGLGTLRRHPEIRWRFKAEDLKALTRTQIKVLKAGLDRLKPGGTLVYSVCTNTRAEAETILEHAQVAVITESIRYSPRDLGQPDAFFAAKLVKN
jgi:16S rRNA (cytosine967-C5)-methyltransferase